MAKLYQMTEEKVAAQIGVSRDRLKEIRDQHLSMGIHFQKNGGGIHYTEEGIDFVILTIAEQAQQAIRDANRPKATPVIEQAPQAGMETLRVLSTCVNPTWVKAITDSGHLVFCRVRSNVSMRRGTTIAKCERLQDGRYICRGRY
jgi:hypothetical protein